MKKYSLALGCGIPVALTFIALVVIKISGGGDREAVKFLGNWPGQFTVDKVERGPDGPDDRKHHTLRGYVNVRLNKKMYTMHMEGEQEQVDIKGTWTITGNQITLAPSDTKINVEGGKEGINPNFKFVPIEDLYQAYEKKITLNLTKDGSTLQGLRTTIAFLEGSHSFKRE